jgi:ketosteroid isomerase-like protein
LRLEVIGDVAYEAGRCKMLVPVAVSKRREEKGKYLALLTRKSNGEWAISCDCWSTDLSIARPEGEATAPGAAGGGTPKIAVPRKP